MGEHTLFHVKKRTLLCIAGCVWMAAGINVARLGILSFMEYQITWIHILLSLAVFCIFGLMFYGMSVKHSRRILGYEQEKRPFWHFFDIKSYCIMCFMMGGGIWLRSSGLAPGLFIGFFYTGLGCALALAGILFWINFFRLKPGTC